MINEIKQDAQERMKKSVEALEHAFAKIRTGRAHPALLDSTTTTGPVPCSHEHGQGNQRYHSTPLDRQAEQESDQSDCEQQETDAELYLVDLCWLAFFRLQMVTSEA